eukprot:TRINITY_DN10017_c0_g3_i1.p1 TRINITY_DN10017_c0_g3~~TRINITY_DN10017_c0_g3_i1.p1  ORF type:complete len:421 (-),score=63.12 TRINITY_DN10017_c0_g3_i1:33-1295(-)
MTARAYDLVILGASGFTGQLACEYLARSAPPGLRWAIAGRNTTKLNRLRESFPQNAQQVPILEVDVTDPAHLSKMASAAKVVANYAGTPYVDKGLPVVEACASAGSCYVDITGEPPFVRASADRYDAKAKETGSLIVHCCGFDSVPSDIGAWLVAKTMRERHQVDCDQIRFFMGKSSGGASGGTIHTVMHLLSEGDRIEGAKQAQETYGLDPPGSVAGPSTGDFGNLGVLPCWDNLGDCWTAPFVMAPVNCRIVRRSNALASHAYGRNCKYSEVMEVPGPLTGAGMALGLGASIGLLALPPTRWALRRWVLPEPGQGPSKQQQDEGFFRARSIGVGVGDSAPVVVARIESGTGGDPGYKCTALMSVEAALCMVKDRDRCAKGGVVTPAFGLGQVLVDRLNAAGMKIQVDADGASGKSSRL